MKEGKEEQTVKKEIRRMVENELEDEEDGDRTK